MLFAEKAVSSLLTLCALNRTIGDMIAMTSHVRVDDVTKTDAYRVIVFNRPGTAVLLERRAFGYDLPLVDIPRFIRSAKEITTILRDRWHVPSVFLFSGQMEHHPAPTYFAALEAQVRMCTLPEGMNWLPVHHAIRHVLKNRKDNILESSYLRTADRTVGADPEPFSRRGWFSSLQDWVRTVISPLGMELKDFLQLNGCETFSLIRFDTTHRPVWFKAVGKPNLHEFAITLAISKLFPEHGPSLLASQPDWHGWLMADAGGSSLDELEDPSAWKSAVTALAALQIESIGKTTELLEAGCKDLCISKLLAVVDPFLDVMADLMKHQTKVPPLILSREELSNLGTTLKDALHCLAVLRIPDTLGHGDFNPGNIIVGPERCTFIDWAEAHVSQPFLTFEYLISHMRKDCPALIPFEDAIRFAYSQRWQAVLSPKHVSEAFLFSPLAAVFAYAVAGNIWRDREELKITREPGYLRSLTRRMKREADSIRRRRIACLS